MNHQSTMTPERWQRLQALFDEALTLDPESRADFIVTACGTDTSLREQLLALVLSSGGDDDFEQRVELAIAGTAIGSRNLEAGAMIGRYRIVRLIGRGGMGAVYLAERADREFEQRVAVKVVAAGALSSRVVARLRSERQILANLSHPNIARLLDGGATADGTPYFAMEYVDGQRIDHYCENQQLDIEGRLRLFQQVCAAMQYAHQNLIVHRDIKASNILVTADGAPKLLDFGIAKLINPTSSATSADLTRVQERVLTPEHASPEQIRGEQVGTVSDIYALGVLLYELLTGTKPFNFDGYSFAQIERAIADETPRKPSVAALEGSRLTVPTCDESVPRLLEGDLDTIVMKAMHKDSQRRYGTASALADDVANFLANRPIAARPDSFSYRTQKFWRRNRWALSSAAMVIVVLTSLIAFYTWRLVQERNTAYRERKTAQTIATYMKDTFRLADPSESRGEKVTVREALDAAVGRIDGSLQTEPRVRLDLLQLMSSAYTGLGLWPQSLDLVEKAVQQERAVFGDNHIELAKALHELSDIEFDLGRNDRAIASLREAWAIRERLGMTKDEDAAQLLLSLAGNLRAQSHYPEALDYTDRAQRIVDALPSTESPMQARVAQSRSYTLLLLGRYAEAAGNAHAARELIATRTDGDSLNVRDNLTDTEVQSLRRLNRFDEAEKLGRAMLTEQLQRYSEDAPLVARTLNNLSHMVRARGAYAEAESFLRRAIASFDKRLGAENLDSATSYHNLGAMLHEAGRLGDAEECLERSLALKRKLSAPNSPVFIYTLLELATIGAERGQREKADRLLAEAAEIVATKLEPNDPRQASVSVARGRLLTLSGNLAGAADEFTRAIGMTGLEPSLMATAQFWLGELALRKGFACEAREPLSNALKTRKTIMPPEHWLIASAENSLAAALITCGERELGAALQSRTYQALMEARPPDDLYLQMAREHQRNDGATPRARAATTP